MPAKPESVSPQEASSEEREISQTEIKTPEKPTSALLKQAQDRKTKERMSMVHTIVYQSLLQEPGRNLEQRREHDRLIETLETLATAPAQKEDILGGDESGVNTTARVEYLNDKGEKIIAYRKTAAGEAVYDAEGFPTRLNPDTGKRERIPDGEQSPGIGAMIKGWKSEKYFSRYAQGLINKYNIPEASTEEFKASLRAEIGGMRLGIDIGGSPIREKVVYDQAKMLGMDVVAPTALREEKSVAVVRGKRVERTTLASVQEGIKSAETGEPGRELYKEELMSLLLESPDKWQEAFGFNEEQVNNLKESLVEAACLHWQTGQLDGHQENMLLLDSGHIKVLDNGLSFSMKRGVSLPGDRSENMHKLRSVPLEVISRHPELMLSDKVRAKCLEQYTLVTTQASPEKVALEQMFKAMFSNRNVAKQEMKDYLLRLRHLADHGRPPEKVFREELFSVGMMTFVHTRSKKEVQEAFEEKERERIGQEFDALLEEFGQHDPPEEIKKPPKRRPPPPPPRADLPAR